MSEDKRIMRALAGKGKGCGCNERHRGKRIHRKACQNHSKFERMDGTCRCHGQ